MRTTEGRFTVKQIHQCSQDDLQGLLPEAEQVMATTSTLEVLEGLSQQSTRLKNNRDQASEAHTRLRARRCYG